MEYHGNAWTLEYKKIAQEKVCGESNRSQALPALTPQKSSSRELSAMEETCAKSTPYSFETLHSRVSGQQSENIALCMSNSLLHSIIPLRLYCAMLTCVYNCCISSKRINLHGAVLQHWSFVYICGLIVMSRTLGTEQLNKYNGQAYQKKILWACLTLLTDISAGINYKFSSNKT